MADGDRQPVGRPTKFRSEFIERVGPFLARGYTLTAFAAECDVSRATINVWMAEHPEFLEAVHAAQAKKARWWETRLMSIAETGGGPGAATAAIFGVKNASSDEYRDKQEVQHSGEIGIGDGIAGLLKAYKGGSNPE